jgi:acyl carrier protein
MNQQFIAHFAEALETNPAELSADTEFKNLPNWDSLAALSVIAMVDEHYGASIGGDELERAQTLADLWQAVSGKAA